MRLSDFLIFYNRAMKMFSVYDSKGQFYSNPFFAKSSAEAIRSFEMGVRDPSTMLSKFPGDFILFELGEFDEVHASFKLLKAPNNLGCAVEFVHSGELKAARN